MPRVLPRLAAILAAAWLILSVVASAVGPISPDAAAVQIQYGAVLFGQGRYREALDAYTRAVPVEDARLQMEARAGVIRSSLRTAEFLLASESASTLFRAAPKDPEVLALYGDARWAMGQFGEAEAAYAASLAVDPAHARGRRGQARVLAARGRLEDALAEARAAVATAPDDPETHQTLSYVFERMRRFEEAASSLVSCINLLPNKDTSEQAALARSGVKFLRSFGDHTPYAMLPADRERRHTIPFRIVNDKIIVQAKINGNRDRVDFVIDTGAESTVLSRRVAQRYSIVELVTTLSAGVGDVGLRSLQLGRLDSIEIGSLKVQNVPVMIKNPPLSEMPSREPEAFSPLTLGLSMSVDYGRRLLTIGPGATIGEADIEMPLWLHRLATVRGVVDGAHTATFVVDTGGEVISISAATARSLTKIRDLRRIRLKVYGTSGWDSDAYLLPGVDLSFQEIEFRNMPVVVLNLRAPSALLGYQIGGIVGHRFLSKYRFDIDLDRSVLRLKGASG